MWLIQWSGQLLYPLIFLSYNVANTVEWSAIVSPDIFSYNVDNTVEFPAIVSPDAFELQCG